MSRCRLRRSSGCSGDGSRRGGAPADARSRERSAQVLNNLLGARGDAADFLAHQSACSESSGGKKKNNNLESLCLCLRLTGFSSVSVEVSACSGAARGARAGSLLPGCTEQELTLFHRVLSQTQVSFRNVMCPTQCRDVVNFSGKKKKKTNNPQMWQNKATPAQPEVKRPLPGS